jgi:hypothetical protein
LKAELEQARDLDRAAAAQREMQQQLEQARCVYLQCALWWSSLRPCHMFSVGAACNDLPV